MDTKTYENDLHKAKPNDEVQHSEIDPRTGYQFITTSGHGYLVVPKTDKNASIAEKICEYGYNTELAFYLEEDCEYSEFMQAIKI